MSVFYTGDIHGDVTNVLNFIDDNKLTPGKDVIVILGDVGLNYYLNEKDTKSKKMLNNKGIEIFCVHGNHEERPFNIKTYHEKKWHDGTVYVEDAYPNLLFAKDGDIFDLDGKKTIVLGGAYSIDKEWRLARGWHWFKDEQPSEEIKKHADEMLDSVDWKVDQVLSHTCPLRYTPADRLLPGFDQSKVDKSTEIWLDFIESRLDYTRWLCGHWHIDRNMGKVRFVMFDFVE